MKVYYNFWRTKDEAKERISLNLKRTALDAFRP